MSEVKKKVVFIGHNGLRPDPYINYPSINEIVTVESCHYVKLPNCELHFYSLVEYPNPKPDSPGPCNFIRVECFRDLDYSFAEDVLENIFEEEKIFEEELLLI